ncbi:MAG TPA: hypothetical protein VLU96_02200 [Gaiellaceae bacterium]|nr:hypothetical protein [Gaiellaceae bacterium]
MNEENEQPNAERPRPADVEPEVIERRSLDAVFQGAQAFGEATGGLGALLLGVSKVKETFRGGDDSADPPPPPSDPPASSDDPK